MPSRAISSKLFTVAFVLAAAAVVWLSLAPVTAGPVGRHVDKIEHFLAYAGLTLLGFAARGRAWPLMAGGIVLFGGGVEVLQALMPTGRMGSVLDGMANAAGVGATWAVWATVARRRRR